MEMTFVSFLIDAGLIALLALSAYRGYRRGIVHSVLRIVFLVASIVFARIFTGVVSPVLSESLPMPGVSTKLASFLNHNLDKISGDSIAEVLEKWGFPSRAAGFVGTFIENGGQSANESVSRAITPAVDRLFTDIIIFVFLFLVLWLISVFILMLIDKAMTLPVLNQTNRTVGLAVGLLGGLAAAFIIAFILSWGVPLLDASFDISLNPHVRSSLMIRILDAINPFGALLA